MCRITRYKTRGKGVDMNDANNIAQAAAGGMGLSKSSAAIMAAKHSILALIIGAIAVVCVIMAWSWPKRPAEAFAALMSTTMASICGGAYVSIKFGMWENVFLYMINGDTWMAIFVTLPIIGVAFLCGFPAWGLCRSIFIYMDKSREKGIDVLIADIKKAIRQ